MGYTDASYVRIQFQDTAVLEADDSSTWSGLTYQKPTVPISTTAHPFNNVPMDQKDDIWRFYRQPGDTDLSDRASFSRIVASEDAKLFRIVHETILGYCGSRGRASARSLLGLYGRFVEWQENLPLELQDVENEPLPHVLVLQ